MQQWENRCRTRKQTNRKNTQKQTRAVIYRQLYKICKIFQEINFVLFSAKDWLDILVAAADFTLRFASVVDPNKDFCFLQTCRSNKLWFVSSIQIRSCFFNMPIEPVSFKTDLPQKEKNDSNVDSLILVNRNESLRRQKMLVFNSNNVT